MDPALSQLTSVLEQMHERVRRLEVRGGYEAWPEEKKGGMTKNEFDRKYFKFYHVDYRGRREDHTFDTVERNIHVGSLDNDINKTVINKAIVTAMNHGAGVNRWLYPKQGTVRCKFHDSPVLIKFEDVKDWKYSFHNLDFMQGDTTTHA